VEPLITIAVLASTVPLALAGTKGLLTLILHFMSGSHAP
jgi:hypothetical protein